MKKNITIYLLLALACLGLQSCLFQEENYFDDSSANRASRCEPVQRTFESGSEWLGDGILHRQGLFAWRHHPALQV